MNIEWKTSLVALLTCIVTSSGKNVAKGLWKTPLVALLTCIVTSSGQNVALNKNSFQSSTYDEDTRASVANDGILECGLTGRISHTLLDYEAWWYVDLGQEYLVERILFWRRAVCEDCHDRMDNLTVSLSTTEPDPSRMTLPENIIKQYASLDVGAQVTLSTRQMARCVIFQVVQRETYLSLCEVEVYEGFLISRVWNAGYGSITTPPNSYNCVYFDESELFIGLNHVGILLEMKSVASRKLAIIGEGFSCENVCDVDETRIFTVDAAKVKDLVTSRRGMFPPSSRPCTLDAVTMTTDRQLSCVYACPPNNNYFIYLNRINENVQICEIKSTGDF